MTDWRKAHPAWSKQGPLGWIQSWVFQTYCDIGDRDGRRENCDLSRLQSCCCAPRANVWTSTLIYHGFYSVELGVSDVSPGEFGWRKLQLWPIQSTMAFGPESEASWQVSRDWIALPGCMWLSCGTCVNFFDMFQRSVGSIRGEMGKVFDESCKSWWPFNLHSESLDMLGLYWTYLWTVNHAGIAGTRTKEQLIHLSFIFLHASGDVGWCRMSMKLISWKWRIFSAADCGQSILDRRTMMWFFLDIQ